MHLHKQLPSHSPQRGRKQVFDRDNPGVALQYSEAGIPVFPCFEAGSRAKEPLTQHGHHDATTDAHQIRAWWQSWPGALVGIPTGPSSRVWVLDIDGRAGLSSSM